VSDGTPDITTDTTPNVEPEAGSDVEAFADAIAAALPDVDGGSEPEPTEAVETSEVEDTPEAEPETPESEAETPATDPGKEPEAPDAEKTVNFDGLSDTQRTTFERLLKDGHVTAEEVAEARKDSMFHAAFTRKTMALAEERKEFAAEMERLGDDVGLLKKIRGDPSLLAAWNRMTTVNPDESVDSDGDDLIDRKTAERLADERIEAREAEKAARDQKQQNTYDAKKVEIQEALRDTILEHDIDKETLVKYLDAESADLASDVDPILHFTPAELQYRVAMRHRLALAEAKAEAADEKLSKRTSKDERTAKQSLPPARRVAQKTGLDPIAQTEADLGLEPDWSNVTGMRHMGG